ncbi:uncharacterized protein FTOL_13695 [Fusarium torulosum]|uniref:Uncharacterized protein n=1 Tax=Fusarium torulosum TaxID=33205 RepID=A0AAE8SQG3_9HYPO|nr:uncharacterized protein FTOL_13695 [Fusarium torulosum]
MVTGLALNRKQLQFLNTIWNYGAFTDLAVLEELTERYKHPASHAQAAIAGRGDYSQSIKGDISNNNKEEEEDSEEDNIEDHSEEGKGGANVV